METKLIVTILNIVGLSSYVGAILLNIGSWKADILWLLAVMFGVVKLVRYALKTWQEFRKEELEIKSKRAKVK